MQRLKFLITLFLFLLPSFLRPQGTPTARPNAKQFIGKRFGLAMEVPLGWQIAVGAGTDLPIFVNFRWSSIQAQGILPKGGATIHIIAEEDFTSSRHRDYTLDEWATFDQRRAAPQTTSIRELRMPHATDISRALISSFDELHYGPDDQTKHNVIVYWQFRTQRFATYLEHVTMDPKTNEYREILLKLMRSVRPL